MEKNDSIRWGRIALLLKIGILGAIIILAGDLLVGWGLRDPAKAGIEGPFSQYLTVSEPRLFWAAMLGCLGVPVTVAGHYGIYLLLRPGSRKYARLYAVGILGFLAFGGAGVHVSSVEAAFFYQAITEAGPDMALGATLKFMCYFLLPLYAILLTGWAVMVYAHLRAVAGGLTPYPRWCWIFTMPAGTLLFSLAGLFGNHEAVNAILVGAFSLGNIWTLAGHLAMLRKSKENWERSHVQR